MSNAMCHFVTTTFSLLCVPADYVEIKRWVRGTTICWITVFWRFQPIFSNLWPLLTVFSRFLEVHFWHLRTCFLTFSGHIKPFLVVSDRFQSISWGSLLSSENVFWRFQPILSNLWSFLTVFSRFHEVHFCNVRMCFLTFSAHIKPFLVVSHQFQSISWSSLLPSENVFFDVFRPY